MIPRILGLDFNCHLIFFTHSSINFIRKEKRVKIVIYIRSLFFLISSWGGRKCSWKFHIAFGFHGCDLCLLARGKIHGEEELAGLIKSGQ
jgi:hypothetical protein